MTSPTFRASALILSVLLMPVAASAQSVFPTRFDMSEIAAPSTLESTGALTVMSGTEYRTQGALTVAPTVAENLFQIAATEDDTTVWVQVLVAAVQNDTTSPSSAKEQFLWAIYDSAAGTWASLQESFRLNLVGGGEIQIAFNRVGNVITATLTSPNSLNLATIWIQAIASKDVTFTQLF